MANLAVANNLYTEAITAYDEANFILRSLCSGNYISSLEDLADIKENTSRDVKVMFEDEMETTDKYECIPIQQMLSSNSIQKATALALQGDTSLGLDLLEKLEVTGVMCQNEVELNAAISNIRMTMLRQEITSQPDARILLEESLSLPAMKVQVARGAIVKKNNISHERRLVRDNLTSSLESMIEAHRVGYSKERSSIIQSLCNQSGFSMFFKNQFSASSSNRVVAKDTALLSAYYMGKFIMECIKQVGMVFDLLDFFFFL